MRLRFHWRMLDGGEGRGDTGQLLRHAAARSRPEPEVQARFCRDAEEAGIDSLLIDFGFAKPDSMTLAVALSQVVKTGKVRFMVAFRPGLMLPTLFVQQVNTLSVLSGGRVCLNIVAGHSPQEQESYGDSLGHDERYARMDEFLAVCRAFWAAKVPVEFEGRYYTIRDGRLNTPFLSPWGPMPEIFVGGNSAACKAVATRRADCWMRFPAPLGELAEEIRPVLDAGVEVGLRLCVIARPTRDEAIEEALRLVGPEDETRRSDERNFVTGSDSQSVRRMYAMADVEWLTPCLWTGAVRRFGAPSVALLGSYDEVADQLISLGELGVSQYILAGWPKWDEMIRFGREVIPRVREREELARNRGLREARAHVARTP
jgi:alkanesulfonate monooxygenase